MFYIFTCGMYFTGAIEKAVKKKERDNCPLLNFVIFFHVNIKVILLIRESAWGFL